MLKIEDIEYCIDIFKEIKDKENWNDYPDSKLRYELNASLIEGNFCRPVYYVYVLNEKVVGFAGYGQLGFDDGVYGLFWLQVDIKHQGIGIGKSLTSKRIEDIKGLGGELILSTTRKKWILERFGFEELLYRGDGYYLMKKEL